MTKIAWLVAMQEILRLHRAPALIEMFFVGPGTGTALCTGSSCESVAPGMFYSRTAAARDSSVFRLAVRTCSTRSSSRLLGAAVVETGHNSEN